MRRISSALMSGVNCNYKACSGKSAGLRLRFILRISSRFLFIGLSVIGKMRSSPLIFILWFGCRLKILSWSFFAGGKTTDSSRCVYSCPASSKNTSWSVKKRWADFEYHEQGGKSLAMVQTRNMAALLEVLKNNNEKT